MADDQLTIVKEEPLHVVGMAPDSQPSTNAGLLVQGAKLAMPYVASAAEAYGKSPTVAAATSKAVNVAAQGAATLKGLAMMNPLDVIAAPRLGRASGNAAYWLTRNFGQPAARGISATLEAIAPYAQTLSTLSGAQGVLDVAQVGEPNRQDIGTLGVSFGQPRSDAEKTAHPALLNMLASKVQDGIAALMHYGLSRDDAVKAISDQTIRR